MQQAFAMATLLVRDYEEAIAFFTNALRFELCEDTRLDEKKRWVVVRPAGTTGAALLLARAASPAQAQQIGKQAGGRVAFFLHTDDFDRDSAHMRHHGVRFEESRRQESYGKVAVFRDLYGNRWDLIEPNPSSR